MMTCLLVITNFIRYWDTWFNVTDCANQKDILFKYPRKTNTVPSHSPNAHHHNMRIVPRDFIELEISQRNMIFLRYYGRQIDFRIFVPQSVIRILKTQIGIPKSESELWRNFVRRTFILKSACLCAMRLLKNMSKWLSSVLFTWYTVKRKCDTFGNMTRSSLGKIFT